MAAPIGYISGKPVFGPPRPPIPAPLMSAGVSQATVTVSVSGPPGSMPMPGPQTFQLGDVPLGGIPLSSIPGGGLPALGNAAGGPQFPFPLLHPLNALFLVLEKPALVMLTTMRIAKIVATANVLVLLSVTIPASCSPTSRFTLRCRRFSTLGTPLAFSLALNTQIVHSGTADYLAAKRLNTMLDCSTKPGQDQTPLDRHPRWQVHAPMEKAVHR